MEKQTSSSVGLYHHTFLKSNAGLSAQRSHEAVSGLAGHIRAVLDEHAKDFHNFVL
jgi:hypothetical protein